VVKVEDLQTGQLHAAKVYRHAASLRLELELYSHLGRAPQHVVLHRGVVPTSSLLLEEGAPDDLVQRFYKAVPAGQQQVPVLACSTALIMELGHEDGFTHAYNFQVGAGRFIALAARLSSIDHDSRPTAAGVLAGSPLNLERRPSRRPHCSIQSLLCCPTACGGCASQAVIQGSASGG
jgi:hypothetical protein